MKALNEQEILEICKLYKECGSLRGVNRVHKRSINTIKKYASMHMNVKTQNLVKQLCTEDQRIIGTYIGLWMGDGTQYYDKSFTVKICCNKDEITTNDFIKDIIYKLFKKKTYFSVYTKTKSAYIKLHSKFIFDFVKKYVNYNDKEKTISVHLNDNIKCYSNEFLEGCLIGLIMTDGYLKKRMVFVSISNSLAQNMADILKQFGFKPSIYIQNRKEKGWNDNHYVYLTKHESLQLTEFLDNSLKQMGYNSTFKELKYGPGEI